MKAGIYTITWRGIEIQISWKPDYNPNLIAHLEIHTKDKAPLPITNTGYRSHFMHKETMSEFNDPADFVEQWLEHESQSTAWKQYEEDTQQMTLF